MECESRPGVRHSLLEHPKSSLEDTIAHRLRSARPLVASLFVAALALTGCAASETAQTEGSERYKQSAATRIETMSPASGSLLGGETITLTGKGLDEV